MQVQCVEPNFCQIPKWDQRSRQDGVQVVDGTTTSGSTVGSSPAMPVRAAPALTGSTERLAAKPLGTVETRKAHLIEVHSAVMLLGCHSDPLCDHVMDALLALRTTAQELVEQTAQTVRNTTPAKLPCGGGDSNQPHFESLPQASKAAILKVMGNDYCIDSCATLEGPSTNDQPNSVLEGNSANRSLMIGRHIICNWPRKNSDGHRLDEDQSGWCIGQVIGVTLTQFTVYYGVDDSQVQPLPKTSCLNFAANKRARVKPFDWFLVRARDLHNPPAGGEGFQRPADPGAGKNGRPSKEARKAPVAGPTSMPVRQPPKKRPQPTSATTPPAASASPGKSPRRRRLD